MKTDSLLPMPLVVELMLLGYELAANDLKAKGRLVGSEVTRKHIEEHLKDGIAKGEVKAIHKSELNVINLEDFKKH